MVLKHKQADINRAILRIELCEMIPNDKSRSITDLVKMIDRAEALVNSGDTIQGAVSKVVKRKISKKKSKPYGLGRDYS